MKQKKLGFTGIQNIKVYKDLDRGAWAELKLKEVFSKLPNNVVSDIGAGFGWFGDVVSKYGLVWQPFDLVLKNDKTILWNLNKKAPEGMLKPGFVVFLEVLEHLSNPELGIKNVSDHIEKGGYMVLTTPNPYSAKSKFSLLFRNKLYAFQPKHLIEHHVYVPLPHVVIWYLENYDFEILEYAVLGKVRLPEIKFKFNFFKEMSYYVVLRMLSLFGSKYSGETQGFLLKKGNK